MLKMNHLYKKPLINGGKFMNNRKTAIVTGSSRGIGRAIAYAFAKNGYNVVINYNNSELESEQLVEEIRSMGVEAIAIKADVSNFDQAKFLVDKAIDNFGDIDVLVNNSGITKDNLILRMKEEDFDKVIDVNLKGTWNMCKHISSHFVRRRKGNIINITSVVGLVGNLAQSNYVASKAGVIGLTKALAKELAGRSINVNAVAPGFIETEMTKSLSAEIQDAYLNQIPLRRFGTPEDVANLCMFLASDQASYITGQVISVNGGMV
jgi:3-oxoacyl-[acyl-carrier protein] reductase